jgi:FkbM family methyltransferase
MGPVEVRVAGGPAVRMGSDGTDPIASMLFWRGADGWEPTSLSVFSALVAPGTTVLDVGANTGLFAVLAGARHPTVQVHAFEPVREVFARLQANVALNRLDNVSCHRLAVSDGCGPGVVHVPRGRNVPQMASLVAGWAGSDADAESVDCTTVDRFCAGVAGPVSVVKVDAEGSEEAAVRGARATLEQHRPFVLCEVLSRGNQGPVLTRLLAELGYRFFALGPHGLEPRPRLEGGIDDDESHNFLCAHSDRLPELRAALRERLPSAQLSRWRILP